MPNDANTPRTSGGEQAPQNPETAAAVKRSRGNKAVVTAEQQNAIERMRNSEASKNFINKKVLGLIAGGLLVASVATAGIINEVKQNDRLDRIETQMGANEITLESQQTRLDDYEMRMNALQDQLEEQGILVETDLGKGQTDNGVRFNYQAGRIIFGDGETRVSPFEFDDDMYLNTGFRYDESFSSEQRDRNFDTSVTNVPQLLAENAAVVLTQEQFDEIAGQYGVESIDLSRDNAGELIKKALDECEDGSGFQQALIGAVTDEIITSDEFEELGDDTEYDMLVLVKDKGLEYEDISTEYIRRSGSITCRKVTYENGQTVYYGECGAAQIVKIITPSSSEGSETVESAGSEASEGSENNENIETGSETSEGSEGNENIDSGSEGTEGSEDSEGSEGNEDAKDPNAIEQNMGIGDESTNNLSQLSPTERTDVPTFEGQQNVDTSDAAGAEAQERADEAAAAAGDTPIYSDDELANMWANFNNNNK